MRSAPNICFKAIYLQGLLPQVYPVINMAGLLSELIPQRHRSPELMDQPGLGFAEHIRALQGLRRINVWSRTVPILWAAVAGLGRSTERSSRPLRILDLATGGGDTPLALARRAAKRDVCLEADGCDASPQAVWYAGEQARFQGSTARFFVLDVLNDVIPTGYDVLLCSLFLHHLSSTEAARLLERMRVAARRLVIVDDLIRSRLGYTLARAGCHLLSRSRVVHADGPASVAAAFTLCEIHTLAAQAGLQGATITRHWPERFLLGWSKA
jgi:SAM-dependent methyltransferase